MKARILDPQVKVYSSLDSNAVSIATLNEGSEVEIGPQKRKMGKVWYPISLSTGQLAYIPGETRLSRIRMASVMQNNVELRSEPSASSPVKQTLVRNTKLYVLEVVNRENQDWARVRDMNGVEGYVSGNTSMRLIQEKTKALGRKNMLTGAMWLIAGIIVIFSGGSPASGGSFTLLGYGALLFGAIMLVSGFMQVLKAPS
jgi:Bacterial SH3 domain